MDCDGIIADSKINNMTKAEPEADAETRHIWRSCCLVCDREVAQFITKTIFAGAILGFSCIMIATDDDPGDSPLMSWYTSMIGLVAGSYIEQAGSLQSRKREE